MSSVQRPTTAPVTPISCRILRSPSHESVTTDLSLFSVSSIASETASRTGNSTPNLTANNQNRTISFRGLSPKPDLKSVHLNKPADIPEIMWLEEGNDIIRSCARLSSVLGLQKSFSTSDITQLPYTKLCESATGLRNGYNDLSNPPLRLAVSELALNSLQRCGYMLEGARLDHASRSCSTWVAVGELASTSQLPSPHGGPITNVNTSSSQQLIASNAPIQSQPPFTTADLVRSVNKKVRQNYIRSRLLTTYRAIERLSQSEFNLDQLEAAAAAATLNTGPGPTELIVPTNILKKPISTTETIDEVCHVKGDGNTNEAADAAASGMPIITTTKPKETIQPTSLNVTSCTAEPCASTSNITKGNLIVKPQKTVPLICPQLKNKIKMNINQNLTIHDIEKERGRPLSKYDRNMMIFNWLHSLDETSTVEDYNVHL